MRQVVIDRFCRWSAQFEGRINHMYLDVRGLVTIGVGNLIDPIGCSVGLPFRRQSGEAADKASIEHEWRLIKSHTELAKKGHVAAGRLCTLHLDEQAIDQLVLNKLAANWAFLKGHHFPSCDEWPACAQLAVSSMAWALGAGFPSKWPQFTRYAKEGNWVGCSLTCIISTAGNPGIKPRNVANVELFLKASRQTLEQYDQL